MSLNSKQQHDLKKFIKELGLYKGRHTELVSVYVPAGYDLVKIIQQLEQEAGTATNIKSASTRKNVMDALERMIQHLRLFKKTPENGLAAFAGNVAPEGKHDVRVWSVDPPIPIQTKIYRCDKLFQLDILIEMMDVKELYGLVLIDRREAVIAQLKGKAIQLLSKHTSNVPGKYKTGGQCLDNSTTVQLHDGLLPAIRRMHNPHKVKAAFFGRTPALVDSAVTDVWATKKQAYTVVTKNPRLSVTASKDHLFFVSTPDGIAEVPAGKLKPGQHLLMPEKITVRGIVHRFSVNKYSNSFTLKPSGRALLRKKRLAKKLYQKQLARLAGIDQTQVSWYEIGRQNAAPQTLRKLCKALQLDYELLIARHATPARGVRAGTLVLPRILDAPLAQFLGYLAGDGSIETDRITFFEQSFGVARSYYKKYAAYFKKEVAYRYRTDKRYHQLRFTSRPLVRFIRSEFPELSTALTSTIPEKVLSSPDAVVAAFLRGFFDADGYLSSPRGIGLGINNKALAHQIQLALLRFSIISSIHEYDNRRNRYSKNTRYTVDITEKQSLALFQRRIGFTSSIRYDALRSLLRRKSETSYVRQLAFAGSEVRRLVEGAGYTLQMFPKVSNFFRNKRMISKQAFRSSVIRNIRNKQLRHELEKLANFPFLPVQIQTIRGTKTAMPMTDIAVRDESFIANGLFVHNSAARFGRIRENAAKEFYARIGDNVKDAFFGNKNLKGIIVGGPGPTKQEFVEGNFITNELKQKIIAMKDVTYTDEFGLQELVDRSQDVLANEEIAEEKKIMSRFFELLSTNEHMVGYGTDSVRKKLKMGAVDTLLLSEALDEHVIEEFEREALNYSTHVRLISTETREGVQLKEFGGIGALLRYEVHD